MKTIIFAAIAMFSLCVLPMSANARDLQRGTFEIGGDIDLSGESTEIKPKGGTKTEINTGSFSGSAIGYVADNFGLGALWSFENTEVKSGGAKDETKTNSLGPILAYNISLQEKWNLTFEGGPVWISIEEDDNVNPKTTTDGWGWQVGGRLSYFINDHVSLDGVLSFIGGTLSNDDIDTDFDYNSSRIALGLTVYLP